MISAERPCWIWTGTVRSIPMTPDRRSARRAIWEAIHGPLPAERLVFRTCGEERCVAPWHATAETPAERFSALTEEEHEEIRERWQELPLADAGDLADRYGVSRATIYKTVSDVRRPNLGPPAAGLRGG